MGRDSRIVHLPSWQALREAVRNAGPSTLVVVDPYLGAGGPGPSPLLRHFLLEHPFTTVVAALRTGPARYDDVRMLGSWGVHEVISIEQESTVEALTQRLSSASTRLSQGLLHVVMDPVPSYRGRMILLGALEHAARTGHAEDLAAELGVQRRTLLRWCDDAGLPAPRRLLAWIRVLTAVRMLEDGTFKVSDVARFSGYSSANALRTVLLSFVGKTAKELRGRGALCTAVDAFRAEIRGLGERRPPVADGGRD